MANVTVVTDSTAYIPSALLAQYQIQVIPLNVIFGEVTLLDGVDISPDEFYEKLKTSKVIPTTSQPSPAAFRDVYEKILDEGRDIISIHISEKLSGTIDSATQAKQMLAVENIEVVDSKLTSMAMGFPVLATAKAAKEGATLQECKALAERSLANSGAIFTVSTLEYLHRGGRIGGAAAFLGTALDLKPILELREGKIEPIERVRTLNKAVDRLLEHFQNRINGRTPVQIAILNAKVPEEANRLLEKARNLFSVSDIDFALISDLSPTIGTHTGPGTLGIAYMAGH